MKTTDKKIKAIAKRAFPEYKGRKFYVSYVAAIDLNEDANWSGGTKRTYKFVRLDNGAILPAPDLAPWNRNFSQPATIIPQGAVCVTHGFFQGYDCGLTVHFPATSQLEAAVLQGAN